MLTRITNESITWQGKKREKDKPKELGLKLVNISNILYTKKNDPTFSKIVINYKSIVLLKKAKTLNMIYDSWTELYTVKGKKKRYKW